MCTHGLKAGQKNGDDCSNFRKRKWKGSEGGLKKHIIWKKCITSNSTSPFEEVFCFYEHETTTRVSLRFCCELYCFIFFISSAGCHGVDRCSLTCTTMLAQHTRGHTRVGVWSPAGGGLLPNLQASWLYSYSSHTRWLNLTAHTQLGKKKCLVVGESIFQGQPAILKIL